MILLDPGESNDGEEEEGGSDLKLNVTWVGAEVTTGKSSLRSKNNTKKVSIEYIRSWKGVEMERWVEKLGSETCAS